MVQDTIVGTIVIYDEYRDPFGEYLAAKLLEARAAQQVIVVGPGFKGHLANPFSMEERIGLIDRVTPKLPDLRIKRSGYPEYGHYRVDFRTGKPLRF